MPLVRHEEDEANSRERRRAPAPTPPDPALLGLQRSAGNAAVARLLARQPATMDDMIAAARARGDDDGREGVDPSEWDDGPEPERSPIDEMIAAARAREAPDTREGVDPSEWEETPEPAPTAAPEPAPMAVSPELAALDQDPQAGPGIWDSRQRARATGQAVEDVQPAPGPAPAAPGRAWAFGQRRQAKFDRMLGAHAQAAAAHAEPDPGALAAQSLAAKRSQEQALQAKRDQKAQHRANAIQAGRAARANHKPKPDAVAKGIKEGDAEDRRRHADMVANDHIEATAYGPVRQRGYALLNQLTAASPFVSAQVRDAKATVDRIVKAKPTPDPPVAALDQADRTIQQAIAREQEYRYVREKAAKILTDIDNAAPAFKSRIAAKSRATAHAYATGPSLGGRDIAAAHRELNEAGQDYEARAKDWEIAQRSRAALASWKVKRATLGFVDKAADDAIAAADADDGRDDFFALQESVKAVATQVDRLSELEHGFQQIHQRLTHVLAVHPASVAAPDQTTLTDGFTNRRTAVDPQRSLNQLHQLMRRVEAPTIERDFNAQRAAGNFAGATAALVTLVNNGVVRRGEFHSVYTTNDDGTGFSAEFGIDGIPEVVIHTHCTKEGHPKDGANASHWKAKSVKFSRGVSHAIPIALRDKLIDRAEIVRRKGFDRSKR